MNLNNNITQELLETVERYYNNTMTSAERSEFENKLNNSSSFKTQVEDIKTLILGIEVQSLKEQLNSFHKELSNSEVLETKQPKPKVLNFVKIAVAASIIIALGSFWYFNSNTNEKLYTEYFSVDPGLPTTMSSNNSFEFYDAMVNYKQGDYTTAINKWEKLLQAKPSNDTLNYFIGVAHLANKNEVEAIPFLNVVTNYSNSAFLNESYYYLGLAYLKNNNVKLAKKNLNFSTVDNSKLILSKLND